ncbi:unnamed protein product [Closterium sp. NIES-54]
MLESFGLSEADPVRTPLPIGFDVHAFTQEPLLRDELFQLYQSIVGSLMYASTTTLPQIAYAVSQLSKVLIARVTPAMSIALMVQPSLSTARGSQWLHCQLLRFAGGVPVFVDNQSAIALAQNACLHGRTKHMQIRWHFIREMVANGEVILRWCPTNRPAADILTKPLPFEWHSVCMSLMGMQPHVGMVLEQDVGGLVLLCLDDIILWMAPLPGQGKRSEGFFPVVLSHLQHEQGGVLIV